MQARVGEERPFGFIGLQPILGFQMRQEQRSPAIGAITVNRKTNVPQMGTELMWTMGPNLAFNQSVALEPLPNPELRPGAFAPFFVHFHDAHLERMRSELGLDEHCLRGRSALDESQ